MSKPHAAIVTIGDEILIGQITDTNSQWLANNLFAAGIDTDIIISIGDKPEQLIEIIEQTNNKYDLVIITGGLGPTNDDKTKVTLAKWFNTELIENPDVLTDIMELNLSKTGNTNINQRNRNQALVPSDCIVLRNKVGTAPGMILEAQKSKTTYVSLPGVPFEMQWLYEKYIQQYIKTKYATTPQEYSIFNIMGITESALAHMLEEWERSLPEQWKPAYLPSPGQIKLRILKPHNPSKEYQNHISDLVKILGNKLIARDQTNIEDVVAELLVAKQLTIGTAESCTGGKIAQTITSKPGASQYFRGSIVAYSNSVKINLLGVSQQSINKHGAVSCEVAEQMVIGASKILESEVTISTTGVAGPTGGSEEKPVGTVWISIKIQNIINTQKFLFNPLRDINIKQTTNKALYMLYTMLTATE